MYVLPGLSVYIEIQESKERQTESRRAGERQEGEGESIDSLKRGWDIMTLLCSRVQG